MWRTSSLATTSCVSFSRNITRPVTAIMRWPLTMIRSRITRALCSVCVNGPKTDRARSITPAIQFCNSAQNARAATAIIPAPTSVRSGPHISYRQPPDSLRDRVGKRDRLARSDKLFAHVVRNLLPLDLALGSPAQNLRQSAVGLTRGHIRLDFEILLAVTLRERHLRVDQCVLDHAGHRRVIVGFAQQHARRRFHVDFGASLVEPARQILGYPAIDEFPIIFVQRFERVAYRARADAQQPQDQLPARLANRAQTPRALRG